MNRTNTFLNFIFAFIPGVGFMYNGLYKMGISIMILFFIAAGIGDFLIMDTFAAAIMVPLWFYSFFKTFEINRRLLSGEYIEDKFLFTNTQEISFKGNYTRYIGIAFVFIGAYALLRRFAEDFLDFRIMDYVSSYIGPVIFIIIGAWILTKGLSKNK